MTVPKKKAKLFTRIGPYDYEVSVKKGLKDDDNKPAMGLNSIEHSTHELDEDQGPQSMWASEWHETTHSIMDCAGIPSDQQDETIIDLLAQGICQVLRDNPHMRDLDAFEAFIKE